MCNDKDLCKIIFNGIDGFDQTLTAKSILRAKTFVDDQGLQTCAFALGKDFRKRKPDRKIDAKSFAA